MVTVQSKFLEAVRRAAETRFLQLVVHMEAPNKGYAYIQRKDSFSSLYAFHFEFGSTSTRILLNSDKFVSGTQVEVRTADLSDGARLEAVLAEIVDEIERASRRAYPKLQALSRPAQASGDEDTAAASDRRLSSLEWTEEPGGGSMRRAREEQAARVWYQHRRDQNRWEEQRVESHRARAVAVVTLLVLAFLFFVPVLPARSSSPNCAGQTCVSNPAYYVSLTNRFISAGGVYQPPGQGWAEQRLFFGTEAVANSSTSCGFGFWYYHFAVRMGNYCAGQ